MLRRWRWIAIGLLVVPRLAAAQSSPCVEAPVGSRHAIQDYAQACLARVGISPAELAKIYQCVHPSVATEIPLTIGGVKQLNCRESAGGPCEHAADKAALTSKFPRCDFPAWLDDRCYGDTYIQKLTTSNAAVKGALLCRHKTRFTGTFDDFDDIAMIVHNKDNGETCWFQSRNADSDASLKLIGWAVPGPVCAGAEDLWLTPEQTKGIECIQCHDSGPWLNSRWLRNVTHEFGAAHDDEDKPYLNSTPPFNQWRTPVFVKYGANLPPGKAEGCTDCHKVAAAGAGKFPTPTDPHTYRTCDEWINRSVGRPSAAFSALLTAEGAAEHVQFWMPDDGTTWSAATWPYGSHVDGLIDCCKKVGAGTTPLPDGCSAYCPDTADGSCPADRWPRY
jgi:hypothetical protein